jgi:hypothetical protein
MYHIRQFKPALYMLVMLGISGFCLAAALPGWFVVAAGLIVLNAMLVNAGRFKPIPRLVANLLTLVAGVYTALRVMDGEVPVTPVGLFLLILQVVKLYEQRGNRDFGQLIVLSLLTMVAAAMLPGGTSLLFGIMLLIWVVLSLYTCLLFHLKVEADSASRYLQNAGPVAVQTQKELSMDPRLRQDERRLPSSLRRLTTVVAIAGAVSAVVIFLGFPRGGGRSFLMPQLRQTQTSTGFSDSVDFQDIARIQQNNELAAHLQIDGTAVGPIYLRGNALDEYQGDPRYAGAWVWRRSSWLEGFYGTKSIFGGGMTSTRQMARANDRLIEHHVELRSDPGQSLFTIDGPVAVSAETHQPTNLELRVGRDGTLALERRGRLRSYRVLSTGRTPVASAPLPADALESIESGEVDAEAEFRFDVTRLAGPYRRTEMLRLATLDRLQGGDLAERLRQMEAGERTLYEQNRLGLAHGERGLRRGEQPFRSGQVQLEEIGPLPAAKEIIEFALDPDVVGVGDDGRSLTKTRVEEAGVQPVDARIASNMERYLRTQFDYSLDISAQAASLPRDRDPMAWFVSEGRRGHCEFFAGTMTLALQSVGIPARVVVGYRTSEYNPQIDRWNVRQSHAHAWVEALTSNGWQRYDPTPAGGDVDAAEVGLIASTTASIKQFVEYLSYTWQENVIAYDRGTQSDIRDSLFSQVDDQVARAMGAEDESLMKRLRAAAADLQERLGIRGGIASIVALIASALLFACVAATVVALLWFAMERWRLRRRAKRIGLDDLPPEEARRLAKQLEFYDDMLRLLENDGLVRRPDRTPREFARSLIDLPPTAFRHVRELTEVFYRVRFGRARVTPLRRRWLGEAVDRLEASLGR